MEGKEKEQNVNTLGDAPVKKAQWGNKAEFFLAVLGYSIGMGSLTRFPYLCMKNGGGAFLIPWATAILLGGIPLFYLELALGQFSGCGVLTVWSFCPAFRGIGYGCMLMSVIFGIYYGMQVGWSLYYLVMSFATDVPWRGCGNSWNSENCYDPFSGTNCLSANNLTNATVNLNSTGAYQNNTCVPPADNFSLPSEDYWNNVILGTNFKGMENLGTLRWQNVLCLFASWLLVFLCMMKGVQSLGKVVYVTATAPYFLLTVLMIRGATLEGSIDGVLFYVIPDFTKLQDPKIWIEAALTTFYSLGPAWGVMITMASYNKFNHKISTEALLIPAADVFTALYAGFVVFSVAGFMAHHSNMPVSQFAASGAGLSFVVFPQAIAEMPISSLWSVLFFLTMITMGIDSQFGNVEVVINGLTDFYPKLRNHSVKVTAAVSSVLFLCGLPFATQGGMYLYILVDWYVGAITLTMVAFFEVVIVTYIYGLTRFSDDIKLMLGKQPNIAWKALWLIITPLFTAGLICVGLWNLHPPGYQGYQYPRWAVGIGWSIALLSFLPIPGFAIHGYIKSPQKTFSSKLASLLMPNDDWVPAKKDLVDGYRAKYSRTCKTNGRCEFCQATGFTNEAVECSSIFKCWICYCSCGIFGSKDQKNQHGMAQINARSANKFPTDNGIERLYPSTDQFLLSQETAGINEPPITKMSVSVRRSLWKSAEKNQSGEQYLSDGDPSTKLLL